MTDFRQGLRRPRTARRFTQTRLDSVAKRSRVSKVMAEL